MALDARSAPQAPDEPTGATAAASAAGEVAVENGDAPAAEIPGDETEAPAFEVEDGAETGQGDDAVEVEDEEADPALDELKSFLSEAGVTLRGTEELEQTLEIAAESESAADDGPVGRSTTSRRSDSGQRKSAEQDTFDKLDESLKAESVDVVVSDDRLTATIAHLDSSTTRQQIVAALRAQKIRSGLQQADLKEALARIEAGEEVTDLVVARGTPPQPGRDGHFEWEVAVGGRAGTILADGSIDLRDRRLITVVQEGQLVGRLLPSRKGLAGKDVLGNELQPAAVTDLEVVTDSHLTAGEADDEGAVEYTAAVEGGVYHEDESRQVRGRLRRRLKIGVNAISNIKGDVDYSTGHVEFNGDVVIDGTVKALFEVEASGSVTIGGNVEPGAKVRAGRDILVSGAVVGAETELEAGGNVMAKFVQKSTVRAGGDVEVGAYMFEASVRARGQITVSGAGEGSGRALVGGLVWAGKGIETPSLGSPTNPKIRVVAGVDPELVRRSEKVRARFKLLEDRQKKLLKAIGVDTFAPRAIKQKFKATPADKKAGLMEAVRKLTEFGDAQKHLRQQLAEIAEQQRELAGKGHIAVSGTIFAGPQLRIGEQVLRVVDDAIGGRYALVEEDGQRRIELVQG